MPKVPTLDAPSVGPSVDGVGRQSLSAPALAFGANQAADQLSTIGKTATDVGNTFARQAETFQALNNKQEVDEANNAYIMRANTLVGEYKTSVMGKAAYDGLPKMLEALEQERTAGLSNLSPIAQQAYNSASRGTMTYAMSTVREHATTQLRDWRVTTSRATIENAQALGVGQPDNPVVQEQAKAKIVGEIELQKELFGWSPETAALEYHKAVGSMYVSQIKVAVDAQNYPKGQEILDANRADMTDEQLASVTGVLKQGYNSFIANGDRAKAFSGGGPATSIPGQPEGYRAAVHAREGSAKNPNSSAVGEGQFIESTWMQMMQEPQFAQDTAGKSREQILALRKDSSIANRAIDAYAAQNTRDLAAAGVAPTAANLGLAHGFGPKGAADILRAAATNQDTPVSSIIGKKTAEINRLFNATVGDVIRDFAHRFGDREYTVAQGTGIPDLRPPAGIDADEYQWKANQAVDNYTQTAYAANPQLQNQVNNSMRAGVTDAAQGLRLQQRSNLTSTLQFIQDRDVQSITDIPPSMLATLTPQQYQTLDSSLRAEANRNTPERDSAYLGFKAMMGVAPAQFVQTNLKDADLTRSQRLELSKEQIKLATKKEKAQQQDTLLAQALRTPAATEVMRSLGITMQTRNADPTVEGQFWQFAGAIDAEMEVYKGTNGKYPAPGSKEMNSIISQVTAREGAKTGGFLGLGDSPGTPVFQVPEDFRDKIIGALKEEGDPNPGERKIAARYRMWLNANAQ